jgi:hypothetical protein
LWRLNNPRCEGVELSVFEHKFCNDILAQLRHRIFQEMEWVFSVNILHNINVCFVAPVHMDYLVFLQRLEHGGPWLVRLSLFRAEAPPLGRMPLSKKTRGGGALRKNSPRRGPRSASVRGRGRGYGGERVANNVGAVYSEWS